MKFLRSFILAAVAGLFQSCFNSEDYIFDEAETTDIKIEASLAKSMSDFSTITKADTFHIGDTIYFLTSVSPSKIIKVQDYHWLMDGKYCSSEYNFKKQINEPGYHKFTFVMKDYFGDMHYDSLEVWIADKPVLNDLKFTPAEGTQAIDPYESIYFTWSAKTNGIKLSHRYHFTLSEQSYANAESKFVSIDTILTEPHFIFHNKLNSFKKYNWTVQAINEYNLVSDEKIESYFYTKGLPGEGSLQATIDIGNASYIPIQLTLLDNNDNDKLFSYKSNISTSKNEISLGAIPASNYHLTIRSDLPDFTTIEKDVQINDGFVAIEKKLSIIDTIAPTIISITGHDTLSFADSIKFIVKDGSGQITSQKTTVRLENEQVLEKFHSDSILTVVLKESEKSWAYRILSISVTDASQNTRTKSFYIEPSTLWFTTNNDTTITSDDQIRLYIQDNNPFGFSVNTFQFFNVTKNEYILSLPSPTNNSFNADLEASLFEEEQTIKSIVIYKNGLQQSKTWKLHVQPAQAKEEE